MLGYTAIAEYADTNWGVSDEAESMRQIANKTALDLTASPAFFREKRECLHSLDRLAGDCAQIDWDGQDATPISSMVVGRAGELVRALPEHWTMPELTPEPDGNIGLDWILGRYRQVSVSVPATGPLAFAWLHGSERGYGMTEFDGRRFPASLMKVVDPYAQKRFAPVRAA